MTPDFRILDHGSVVTLRPQTPAAWEWVDENLPQDVLTVGGAVAIEPRFIDPIAEGIQADGLTIGDEQ